jgi:toxin FitB
MFLLDTNVISEVLRPAPSTRVVAWLNTHTNDCTLCSITLFELNAGVAMLPDGARRNALAGAVAAIRSRFGASILPFDAAAADESAALLEQARKLGLGLHQIPEKLADLQIAGIANASGNTLATRNTGDFQGLPIDLINPWDRQAAAPP